MQRKPAWLLLAACFLLAAPAAFAQQKGRVVVQQFANLRGIGTDSAQAITRLVRSRIGASKVVTLVTRNDFDALLRERKFQDSDYSDRNKTVELGNAVGADYVLVGEVELFDGEILVTARMIDLNTAEQVSSSDVQFPRLNQARASMEEFTDRFIGALSQSEGGTGGGSSGRTGTGGATPTVRPGAAPAGMVPIPGGTFTMGSPESEPERSGDETQHQVTVSSFYMGKYEVTQAEYQKVMGTNPSHFKGDNLPVECVSWYDAIEYCNARSRQEGLREAYTINKSRFDPNNEAPTGEEWNADNIRWIVTVNKNADGYRLPTEAEWEYACRAGTTTPFSTGNNITTSQANYDGNNPYGDNDKGEYRDETVPADSFYPNRWGLYNMHGNVREWCWDWYRWDYSSSAQTDPAGAASGSFRVARGGGWNSDAKYLRSAYRYSITPSYRNHGLGFRVVRP